MSTPPREEVTALPSYHSEEGQQINKRLMKNIPQAIGRVRALIAFRKMFVNYGCAEGVKQILAKQIQQILERDKQPNLIPAIAQSSAQ